MVGLARLCCTSAQTPLDRLDVGTDEVMVITPMQPEKYVHHLRWVDGARIRLIVPHYGRWSDEGRG